MINPKADSFLRAVIGLSLLSLFMSVTSFADCDPPPQGPKDFDVPAYYTDKSYSIVDPKLKEVHDRGIKVINDFRLRVSLYADRYYAFPNNEKAKADGRCAMSWLESWARSQAFLGEMKTAQSYYERKWLLAGMGLSYAKMRALATAQQKSTIEGWFDQLADRCYAYSLEWHGEPNNHRYWDGLAVGVVGLLINKEKYTTWAKQVFNSAMDQVASDGTLTRELERKARASLYHSVAAQPLVMLSSIFDLDSPKLTALVELAFHAFKDPTLLEKRAGAKQEANELGSAMSWLEVYLRRHPNAEIESFVASRRPMRMDQLGGNLSVKNPLEHPAH